MKKINQYEIWFATGSQHLYGPEALEKVKTNAAEIINFMNASGKITVEIKNQSIVTTPNEIFALCEKANQSDKCIGLIVWMHTFSPAKMWIGGLKHLSKPLAHLHTQFNTEIPWDSIDMDYMNLHQAAHGDREMGFMMSRMGKQRKVIVGHWKEQRVLAQIDVWGRVAAGWHEMQHMKVARIGDNMREVAVTEGDKVAAQLQFGFSVNGYGLGDVVKHVNDIQDTEVDQLVNEYCGIYEISNNLASSESLRDAARIELGLKQFLEAGKFKAFTTTFENLHGLKQLPGISAQRLMEAGYGFGAEGDWKTAALLRAVKVMDEGLVGGTSFMEDYTYNFLSKHSTVLGSHMLEICPSIANGKPKCEIHPLSIGGKEDPVRLVFDVDGGKGINASLIDMGNRFRMVLNEVDVVKTENQLPKLPVARVLWEPMPDLATAAEAWLLAGGAHHTVFSKAIGTEYFEDFCDIAGIELLIIDEETRLRNFRNEIRWNDVYYQIKN